MQLTLSVDRGDVQYLDDVVIWSSVHLESYFRQEGGGGGGGRGGGMPWLAASYHMSWW